jgi:uncharacterized protein YndB with AHSA1/START domain
MEKEITIVRTFDASPETIWQAWADPKKLAQWWGPKGVTTPECRVDVRVGGEIYAVMLAGPELGPMAGQRWPMKGVFKEVVENEKLVFANNAVAEDGTILIEGETTVLLEDAGAGKTKMTLTARGVGKAPQAPQMLAGMQQGWGESIDKLGVLIAQ